MRRLLLLFVVLAGVLSCIAQPRIQRELQYAALGGVSLSQYSFTPKVTQSQARGFVAGVGVRYIEEKFFGLAAELLVAQRGIQDDFSSHEGVSLNHRRMFTYVEVPVLSHIYFNLGKKSEIAVDLGPKMGFFLSESSSGNTAGNADFERIQAASRHGFAHHTLDVTQKFDYGIQGGIGYELKVNPAISVQLQGRYYFGLGNIFPDAKSDLYENSANQSIQILLAVWFHKKIGKFR